MFFSSSTQGLIMEANLDGSGLHTIDTGLSDPVGMGVDPVAQKVYWTGGTSTQSANFDGSNVQTVLNLGGRDVIVNPTTGKLYIGGTSGIYSANLDGSDSQLLLTSPTEFSQMGIDFTTGKIYWIALNPGTIYEANLDGSDQQTLIPGSGCPAILLSSIQSQHRNRLSSFSCFPEDWRSHWPAIKDVRRQIRSRLGCAMSRI